MWNSTDPPLVSVLMPVWNGEAFLAEAIESVLAQTLGSFELIVINDGSTDGTGEILTGYQHQDHRVHVGTQENQGIINALNRGLALARGRYVARLDADDACLPERLAVQVGLLERECSLVMAGSECSFVDEAGRQVGFRRLPLDDTSIRWRMLFDCPFCHSAVILRAETLSRNGLRYSTNARHAEDYDLWSRLIEYGRCVNLPQPLVRYRRHSQQTSLAHSAEQNAMATKISQRNLAKLGLPLADADVRALQRLFYGPPARLTPADVRSVRLMLRAVELFSEQPGMTPEGLWVVRRTWLKHILLCILRDPLQLRSPALLGDVLRLAAAQPSALLPRRVHPVWGQ